MILRRTPKALARAIASAPMRRIRARSDSNKWSAGEILAHLADLELLWGCRMRLILGQSGVAIVGMDQDDWASERRLSVDRSPTLPRDVHRDPPRQPRSPRSTLARPVEAVGRPLPIRTADHRAPDPAPGRPRRESLPAGAGEALPAARDARRHSASSLVHEAHRDRALAHGRGDPLDVARAHVADREHPGTARLEQMRAPRRAASARRRGPPSVRSGPVLMKPLPSSATQPSSHSRVRHRAGHREDVPDVVRA